MSRLDLLLVHDDDHEPFLADGGDSDGAAAAARPVGLLEEAYLADISASAGDLTRQRWALLYPDSRSGKRLARSLADLAERRAEQQGSEVLRIPVPLGMTEAEAMAWRTNELPDEYGGSEARRPRYLCLAGDMDGISLATQQVLATDSFPGRVVCDDEGAYQAYADKVARFEDTPSGHSRARLLFYTVQDGTDATERGRAHLVEPCAELCDRLLHDEPHELPAAAIEHLGLGTPDPDEFLSVARQEQPAVMLSVSHGLGPPRRRRWTADQARERQGAMSFGREGALDTADVGQGPFLPGGFWFYFACFGAGTPAESGYHHWLELLREGDMVGLGNLQATLKGLAQEGGFTSATARAALANPDGPLNVMGHVDLAWTTSFEAPQDADGRESRATSRSDRYVDLLARRVRGERAGVSLLDLQRWTTDASEAINQRYDRARAEGREAAATADDKVALGNLWMLRQDLRGYVLLGDPAARLPLDDATARGAQQVPEVGAGASSKPSGKKGRSREAVVLELLSGRDDAEDVADDNDIPESTLRAWEEAYREAGRRALEDLD